MVDMMKIPTRFWATISDERFEEIVCSGSYLSLDETRTVYRMQDLTPPEPIQPVQVLINKEDLAKILDKLEVGAEE